MIEEQMDKRSLDLNGFYRGEVLDNNDPTQNGRVKIKVFGVMADESITADMLPWASPAFGVRNGSGSGTGNFYVPRVNSRVWVFFECGDHMTPVYLAEAPDGVNGQPSFRTTNYPNRVGYRLDNGMQRYEDLESDVTRYDHPSGNYYQTDGNGTLTENVVQDIIRNVTRDVQETVLQDVIKNITRNMTLTIGNNLSALVSEYASIIDRTGEKLCFTGMGPIPTILQTEPSGWVFCAGKTIGKSSGYYSGEKFRDLFNVVKYFLPNNSSSSFDGGGTVILPDMRGKVPTGLDNIGGSVAGIVTRVDGVSPGATGGEEYHKLTIPELARHRHGITVYPSPIGGGGGSDLRRFPTSGFTDYEGNDVPHNNMQPYLMVNYLLKI